MEQEAIRDAVTRITEQPDPAVKHLLLASLCSSLWKAAGNELVVVGGSAIEILTEGAYTSGDVDMCYITPASVTLRKRQELMGLLGAEGGPRSWKVAGAFLDLLGPVESFARTPFRKVEAPYGQVLLMKPEDLLVERTLVSVYPQPDSTALSCARILATLALQRAFEIDWKEVLRIAALPEYRIVSECTSLVSAVANELGTESPYNTD